MGEQIRAVWTRTIVEKDNGYTVCRYLNEQTKTHFIASGYLLPTDKSLSVCLYGDWEKWNGKTTFHVESHDIELPIDEEGTVSYLRSLRCGIGENVARILFEQYGTSLWQIIEEAPDKLKKTKGCSRINTDKLVQKYNQTMQMRNLMTLFQVGSMSSVLQVQRLASKLGDDAVGKLKRNPYQICDFRYSFAEADALAIKVSFDRNRPERISAAVISALRDAENQGHLYMPIGQLINQVRRIVTPKSGSLDISESAIRKNIAFMVDNGQLMVEDGAVYRTFRYKEEVQIAKDLARLSAAQKPRSSEHLNRYIFEYEKEAKIKLDPQQRQAILDSFQSCVHVITGGPGTGKTTILKGILHCHKKIAKEKDFGAKPLLMAPTGRASRRMTEATGYGAQTIHKSLGLLAETEQEAMMFVPEQLSASIIIMDEASMLDNHLAAALFRAVPSGTQIILVGDVDQLPSVGCGNVLREIINSRCISVTRLETIFRQADGNSIIANAKRIREGDLDLEWDDSFQALLATQPSQVYDIACALYRKCVAKYGMDHVILLNPYRVKGTISSDEFNRRLQDELNPATSGNPGFKVGGTTFRVGDRVMQTKNTDLVANGDVGYIVSISQQTNDKGKTVQICGIQFPDISVLYERKDMENVSLAYCCTVHKSQGSEYDTVLVVMHDSHQNMLRRNLIYTAITRAVYRVAVIGTPEALSTAISTDVVDRRNTKLGSRLRSAKGYVERKSDVASVISKSKVAELKIELQSRLNADLSNRRTATIV